MVSPRDTTVNTQEDGETASLTSSLRLSVAAHETYLKRSGQQMLTGRPT